MTEGARAREPAERATEGPACAGSAGAGHEQDLAQRAERATEGEGACTVAPARERAERATDGGGPPRLRARFGPLRVPYVPLGTFPTPVERLDDLSAEVGAEVWVKRDDRSGTLYGGNKVRKLEVLLGDALARRRETVVTIGAYGSHHALATATYAAHVGLKAHLVLYPQPLTPHVVDDLLLDHGAGARLTRVPHAALAPFVAAWIAARSRRGVYVPAGGSSALGALGYVEAGLELGEQVRAGAAPAPEVVFVAAGTCGTLAGLALGLELAGLRPEVVGVRVVPAVITNMAHVARLLVGARRILARAGARLPAGEAVRVRIDPDELGPGYGVDTPACREAVARLRSSGLELEGTYTGKAAAALLRGARGPFRGRRILFWDTYSSVDLGARLAAVDPRSVPGAFLDVLRAAGRV